MVNLLDMLHVWNAKDYSIVSNPPILHAFGYNETPIQFLFTKPLVIKLIYWLIKKESSNTC